MRPRAFHHVKLYPVKGANAMSSPFVSHERRAASCLALEPSLAKGSQDRVEGVLRGSADTQYNRVTGGSLAPNCSLCVSHDHSEGPQYVFQVTASECTLLISAAEYTTEPGQNAWKRTVKTEK